MEEQIESYKQNKIDKYNSALQLLFYEGQISWQMNLLFIGLNVGIGTIIGGFLEQIENHEKLLGIFSILGLIINIAWLGTFRRNNRYYHFRMAQARKAEPKKWKLLRKQGYKFSKAIEITILQKGIDTIETNHKLSWFEKQASNKRAIEISIWLFIGGFTLLECICIFHLEKYF